MNRKLWAIGLAAWFSLWGLLHISNVHFEAENLLTGVLALAVAVLALLDR